MGGPKDFVSLSYYESITRKEGAVSGSDGIYFSFALC